MWNTNHELDTEKRVKGIGKGAFPGVDSPELSFHTGGPLEPMSLGENKIPKPHGGTAKTKKDTGK